MNRETVIKAIDICLGHGKCDDCGYRIKGGYSTMDCRKPMMRDALALLKEQEESRKFYAEKCDELYSVAKSRTEVVRCKECIYWDEGHTEECNNSNSVCFHSGWCKPEWFCGDGEHK